MATTGRVFAQPVVEMGLLMRTLISAMIMRIEEIDGNRTAHLLSGADVGIIGFREGS